MARLDGSVAYARDMLSRRAEQDSLFDAPLRATMAWDILLLLYVADAEGRRIVGREAIEAVGARAEAGQRWLALLKAQGLVIGSDEPSTDTVVTIAPHAVTGLETYIERCRRCGTEVH